MSTEAERGCVREALAVASPACTRTEDVAEAADDFLRPATTGTGKAPGKPSRPSLEKSALGDGLAINPSPVGVSLALLLRGRIGGRSTSIMIDPMDILRGGLVKGRSGSPA